LTKDADATVTVGAVEVAGLGNPHPRYLRIHDLDFISPFNADGNGLGIGVSINTSAQIYFNGGSHTAVTNCRLRHTDVVVGTTIGAFRAITLGTGGPTAVDEARWIEGNSIDGARHGIFGTCRSSIIRKNTIRRVLSDAMQISHCTGLIIEGNRISEKIYGYTPLTPTAVALGATTVFTVADSSSATVGEPAAFTGFGGGFGSSINGQMASISAKTGTTITVNINSTGYPAWDGLGGELQAAATLHGDMIQFNENLGAIPTQDNVKIRGNIMSRGETPGSVLPDGQGIFGGSTGTTSDRSNWLIEGNIYVGTFVNGIRVSKTINATVRSNTIIRILGIDASQGGSNPAIFVGNTSSAILLDNISNAYFKDGTMISDIGNATVSLTTSDAFPATSESIAEYVAAFTSPVTIPNTSFEPEVSFATRVDGGSVFPGPIYPGATPYFNFNTLVYTDPRA
jgi:hypothetical protein